MPFNEDTRVKIPAIVHLTRLGYSYLPGAQWGAVHGQTNIFVELFKEALCKINEKDFSDAQINEFLSEINTQLDFPDLGRTFYRSLTGDFKCKLIDFENFDNNLFHVVTELTYKNDQEEFRPDIILLINGMPLAFVEVKKPNNRDGILAERQRIHKRFANQMFRKFMNITQILVFSNNQEYDDESVPPIQGAFYATPDSEEVKFNTFREENLETQRNIPSEDPEVEKLILLDNNLVSILDTPEYGTAKRIDTPTNRILSSLFNRDRLSILLKYGIAYVEAVDKLGSRIEKHIMRYPQLFATLAIEQKLSAGVKKGIVWHTQGSGKTALAFYNVYYLRDFFQKQKIIAKFYFIVDRLDLATQARNEFVGRGLTVEMVDSKEGFIKNIKTTGATGSALGQQTITVVNIQKFSSESFATVADYALNIQRVYFLDEVHRSYNPTGSFLANLITSDRNAILIGLTGTPLIMGDHTSRDIFGDYFHKYYYNKSIADGYTLKLIREGIETKFRNEVNNIVNNIITQQGSFKKNKVFSHPTFVEPLVRYILEDFRRSRIVHNDDSIGAMIVCDSADQARAIFESLCLSFASSVVRIKDSREEETPSLAAETVDYQTNPSSGLTAALILHDEDTIEIRKDHQSAFKRGEIDFLVVYNMLLTGFDAKRLKKLYLTRLVKAHNLLQTLTRVNRPYKKFRYGYVVDFADIRREFDETNRLYFQELQEELGDEIQHYSDLFKSQEDIQTEIDQIKELLFLYDFSNLEEFQQVISQITDKGEIMALQRSLDTLRGLYNIIKIMGYSELLDKFSFDSVNKLFSEVSNRIDILNLKESLESEPENTALLNMALERMNFTFRKISEHELKISDKFREELERTRKELESNFDKKDPVFITLFEELKRLFKKKHIEELTAPEMNEAIGELGSIYNRASQLNNKDAMLAKKYENDVKFARIHKRIRETNIPAFASDMALHEALIDIKHKTDRLVLNNRDILKNPDYFAEATKATILHVLEEMGIRDLAVIRFINRTLVNEYFIERAA